MCTVLILWLRKNCEGYALVNYQLTSYWEYDISYFDPVKKVDSVRWLLINEYELIEEIHLRNLLEIEYDAKNKNYDDVNNNCSKRKVGIYFLKKFLYCEIFFNVLHYAQVDGAKDTANYKNDR